METTFGRTVETRFINTTPIDDNLNSKLLDNCLPSSASNFNSLNLSSIKSNNLKRQQMRQQQLQHIYLNSYKECNAPSQLKLNNCDATAPFLRPMQVSIAPSSAILTRKKFKHLVNVPANSGYASDGDYGNNNNNSPDHPVMPNLKQTINPPEFKFKRLNSSLSGHTCSSDYEEGSINQNYNDDNDLLFNTNFINMTDKEYDLKLMRYKSIERQHAKYVREHKSFQEKKKLEQNKIDSYRCQYLNERLNEPINTRLTHLLSPKILPKEKKPLILNKNTESFSNYNERIQYLLNKNQMRLQQQQQQQQQRQCSESFNLNVPNRQERVAMNGNNLNLANYLTWKNCGNIYPSSNLTKAKPNETNATHIVANGLNEENFAKHLDSDPCRQFNNSIRVHSKSISTPSTPQLSTLPRYTMQKKTFIFKHYIELFN
jgi:hypothetical protein